MAEKDLSNRCEQCTDDRPFNLSEGGGSIRLRGECHGGLLNTHFQMSRLPPLAEEDLSNRCEQCTDDRPFNLSEGGESDHLEVKCQEECCTFARSCHC